MSQLQTWPDTRPLANKEGSRGLNLPTIAGLGAFSLIQGSLGLSAFFEWPDVMQANDKAFALYFENIFKIAPAKSDFGPLAMRSLENTYGIDTNIVNKVWSYCYF
jgi:hypothetical protein